MPEFTDTKHDCNKPAHSCLKDGDNYPKYALTLSAALQSERKKVFLTSTRLKIAYGTDCFKLI